MRRVGIERTDGPGSAQTHADANANTGADSGVQRAVSAVDHARGYVRSAH